MICASFGVASSGGPKEMPTYICGTGTSACEKTCRVAALRVGMLCPTAPELREIAKQLETTVGALIREGGFGFVDDLSGVDSEGFAECAQVSQRDVPAAV
ncbi:MAG: hypothetical protein K0S49_54 [Microbacterium sp.]|nr:hypothetical protein [Microbacterium sp.]